MKRLFLSPEHTIFRRSSIIAITCSVLASPLFAQGEAFVPPSVVTPDLVETSRGTFNFDDGVPTPETSNALYDQHDLTFAYRVYMDALRGVSIRSLRRGMEDMGVGKNEVMVFSELMDAKSLFLTPNADTIYVMGWLDLSDGPVVIESPPGFLGIVQDAWFHWVTDMGSPGRDRGIGGKYLFVPPGYRGELPDGGYFVSHAKTNNILWFGRSFLKDGSDPKPTVETIKSSTKVYPYEAGGVGISIARFLEGGIELGKLAEPPETVFHEGTGKVMNTLPPSDWSYYQLLNEVVQAEPRTALDVELMGPIAALGIVKGKPFEPDERMKKIMTDAAALGNAASRNLLLNPRDPDWFYYPDSSWFNMLFESGYNFETPIPEITAEGAKPYEPTGYRQMDARTAFFYGITGITPAMAMRLTGVGSQYLLASKDADKNYFDGSKTYKVTLPKDIPEANFWSLTVYDNMTRSMLDTPQNYPRAGSQSYPSPAAEPNSDGSTTVYFSPSQPADVERGNWIQTDPEKGWFVGLRLYSPLQPFFDKSWRISEIELVDD